MNNVNLIGRLTSNPELKQTNSGLSVCSVSIAVNRQTKDEQGNYKADFINLQAWRHTAEFLCKYFKKGDMLGLTGAIQTRQYQDKDTGKNRTAFEVVVSQVYFTGGKSQSQKSNSTPTDDDFSIISCDSEDLPF